MKLTVAQKKKGFKLMTVHAADLKAYMYVKKVCYKQYVDTYYGGWDEDVQTRLNTEAFYKMMQTSFFMKLLQNAVTVGFLAYDEQKDQIAGMSIQMLETARGQGVCSCYLESVTALSARQQKPAFLKVFKTNPAQRLYKRFGFRIYDETATHYRMRYDPQSSG